MFQGRLTVFSANSTVPLRWFREQNTVRTMGCRRRICTKKYEIFHIGIFMASVFNDCQGIILGNYLKTSKTGQGAHYAFLFD